jgi:hypothetical protein
MVRFGRLSSRPGFKGVRLCKHKMNPKMEAIWKQLPNDLFLENVVCFLDVDTRRAFNVTPRKLAIPKLNIHTPIQIGNVTRVKLADGAEIIYDSDSYIFSPRRDRITFTHQRYLRNI